VEQIKSSAGISRRQFIGSSAAVAVGAMLPGSAAAAESGNSSNQYSQRLFKGWEHYRGSLGGPWEVWRDRKIKTNVKWRPVEMPHCFNAFDAVDPDTDYYQGPGWYRTRLQLTNPFANGRTLLHFEGAGQKTTVFVFLEQVGHHVGGYDEFVVDINDAVVRLSSADLQQGVPIAVLCDNSRDLDLIPSQLSDFNIYGGLYRYVNLAYVPAISLERVHIEAQVRSDQTAKAVIKARLYNPAASSDGLRLAVKVLDPAGGEVFRQEVTAQPWSGEKSLYEFTVASPELWSPSHPALYRCELNLTSPHGQMTVEENFGFRYYEFLTQGPFKLNGQRLLIRGTQRHEDHAGLGAAMPEDLIRREMQLIKDMGANFIRLGHYQQSRIVLDLCDQLGFLVWEEVPWCRGGVRGPAYKQQGREMLRNMIDQHFNHPSVILWGLGNENDWPGDTVEFIQNDVRAYMSELSQIAHQMDPGRKTAARRCEFAKDIPDVYSPSIWMGWYRGRYTEYEAESFQQMQRVNHFTHMEWGGDSHARRHSEEVDRAFLENTGQAVGYDFQSNAAVPNPSVNGNWSETYICDLFDWCLKAQETMPWLSGAAQWIFKDFSTPGRPQNPIPGVNQKGVVERDLTLKEGYHVFQSYWAEKLMVHIYGHSRPVRWGEARETKLVRVYSNCDTAELFLNGESCGTKKRNCQDFPAAGLRWPVRFNAGMNRLRAVARKGSAVAQDEIIFRYQTEKWGKPTALELRELSRKGDSVTIEARLRDDGGRSCLDARNQVRFELAGDGRLRDNLGTSTASRVVELYNARAEITVWLRQGKSTLSVATRGIATAFLSID
jgi:beta-galactosidase